VRLDPLDRDPELVGDLLVGIAAGDVAQDLALRPDSKTELGIDGLRRAAGEGVEDETQQSR